MTFQTFFRDYHGGPHLCRARSALFNDKVESSSSPELSANSKLRQLSATLYQLLQSKQLTFEGEDRSAMTV